MRYLAQLYTFSCDDGIGHAEDLGLFSSEAQARVALKQRLDKLPADELNERGECELGYDGVVERGELHLVDLDCYDADDEHPALAVQPDLSWEHGFSDVRWRADDSQEQPPVIVSDKPPTVCRDIAEPGAASS